MKEYPKIQSVFRRYDNGVNKGKFIEGEWSLPEFEFLQNNDWVWTEKIDGMNVRVKWFPEMNELKFEGRTDNSQMPVFLLGKLQELFTVEKFREFYPDSEMCLYGEGYGAKIQKGGGNYISDGVSFVLFDMLIDGWWLNREGLEDIAKNLGISVVPIEGFGNIEHAVSSVKHGIKSHWGDFRAEGIVLKPYIELQARNGCRIITKMKYNDFLKT